jgi:hypothetical protein
VVAHLVKQHENAAENVTPTHGTVLKLIRKVEGVGHKFLMKITFHCLSSFWIYMRGK